MGQELFEVLDHMSMEDSDSEQTDAEESDDEPDSSRSVGARKSTMSTPTSQPHRIHEEPTPKPPPPAATPPQSLVDPQVLKVIQEVIDEIFQNIDKCPENVNPITFLHELPIVDCGGQPQFHEVLPIFLRKMSLIVFVIMLSEELSSRPIIE